MSQYADAYNNRFQSPAYEAYAPPALQELPYVARSKLLILPFVLPVLTSAVSWLGGGIPALSDISFLLLTLACVGWLIEELVSFTRRFGVGGITLTGGVLLWFCHDYFTNWFGNSGSASALPFPAIILAKATFLTCLLVLCMIMGLYLPVWNRGLSWVTKIPEPRSHAVYPTLVFVACLIGLIPYFLFASEAWYITWWKSLWAGRSGGFGFTVGRDGNVNYSWGAYLAQLMQIGQMGALLGVFYAVLIARSLPMKVFCWVYWVSFVLQSFGSGTRGEIAFSVLPVMGILFLKYQAKAAERFKKFSIPAYGFACVLGFITIVTIQIQITYRNVGFGDVNFSEVKTKIEGNSMFTEGLSGMAIIPDYAPFLSNRFPGEGAVLAIPTTIKALVIGPIPRALWHSKPIDPLWLWYKSLVTGTASDNYEGTTVSTGLVGDWYFRYGIAGVIQGGLLMGWLYLMFERILLNSRGRPVQMMLAVSLLVFMFRSYRNFIFISLYPILIGTLGLVLLIKLWDMFSEKSEPHSEGA